MKGKEGHISESIIFILGPPRSGTTLLLNCLLNGQPAICGTTNESFLFNRRKEYRADRQSLLKFPFFGDLLSAVELQDLAASHDDLTSVFNETVRRTLERKHARYFAEKTPSNMLWYKSIRKFYPHSTWILISRDPAATIYSIATTKKSWFHIGIDRLPAWFSRKPTLRYLNGILVYNTYYWVSRRIQRHKLPAATIRYEDLVSSPDQIRQQFEKLLILPLNPFDPSPPYSTHSSKTTRQFHAGNISHHLQAMPAWGIRVSHLLFGQQTGIRKLLQIMLQATFAYPLYLAKQVVNILRRSRS